LLKISINKTILEKKSFQRKESSRSTLLKKKNIMKKLIKKGFLEKVGERKNRNKEN